MSKHTLPTRARARKAKPAPHQVPIIRKAVAGLHKNERGRVIMPCRTGKTFIGAFIAKRLKARRVLLLVPNLGLAQQAIGDWRKVYGDSLPILAVCSDASVGTARDEMRVSTAELEVPTTTDPNAIAKFLYAKMPGVRLVISTYHSSPRLAEAQKQDDTAAFCLAIADEAHRCAGGESYYNEILDGERIIATRRLFMTATPRIYTESAIERAGKRGKTVLSMDDERQFGPELASMTFGEARAKGLIADWQLVVVPVTSAEVYERVSAKPGKRCEATYETASMIALLKAVREYKLAKVLSFHSSVRKARQFKIGIAEVRRRMKEPPAGTFYEWAVAGGDDAEERRKILEQFGSLNGDSRCFLANCRCLGEGVTMPDLDCVAFLDPKKSVIDIVQALSRALGLRKDGRPKMATFFVPIFLADGRNEEEAIKYSAFGPTSNVISALRSVDDRVAEYLWELRERRDGTRPIATLPPWLRIPKSLLGFEDQIRASISRLHMQRNNWTLESLIQFVSERRHAGKSLAASHRENWAAVVASGKHGGWLAIKKLAGLAITHEPWTKKRVDNEIKKGLDGLRSLSREEGASLHEAAKRFYGSWSTALEANGGIAQKKWTKSAIRAKLHSLSGNRVPLSATNPAARRLREAMRRLGMDWQEEYQKFSIRIPRRGAAGQRDAAGRVWNQTVSAPAP